MNQCDFFLIAGEPSGDALGASLLKGLKAQPGQAFTFEGVGGPQMQAQGFQSLMPMDELCVMGIWEVLWQIPRLLKIIEGLCEIIEERQPKVLVTIDLPDFNFRIAENLKKRGAFKGKIVHYVAPSVWAWRPGRAKKIAAFLDGLMCLFPFEPPYFEKEGLKTAFVGHPLVEVDKNSLDPLVYRQQREITDDEVCLGVFFGSRAAEIDKMTPVFVETVRALLEQYPNLNIIAPTLPHLELNVLSIVKSLGKDVPVFVEPDLKRKWNAMAACDLALAVSGTVGLELSYIGVPHVVAYKAHPLTAIIVRKMAKIRHVHLGNILLNRDAVPEFLQGQCSALNLTKGVMRLLRYEAERTKQEEAFAEIEKLLYPADVVFPSEAAARFVLEYHAKAV